MLSTTLSFNNLHMHGELFGNMFRARREVFVDRNKWDLPTADGMEYDQYDTPASRWIAVHNEKREILAGVRLTPTTARNGIYSYMLRDAQLGLIEHIPHDVMSRPAPIDPHIWEGTRIFVSQQVPTRERLPVHLTLIHNMISSARDVGASNIIGIIPETLVLIGRRYGFDMEHAGPVMEIDGVRNVCVDFEVPELEAAE